MLLVSSISRQGSDLILKSQNVVEEYRRAGRCGNMYMDSVCEISRLEKLTEEIKENIKLCVVTESSFCHQIGSSKVAGHIVY